MTHVCCERRHRLLRFLAVACFYDESTGDNKRLLFFQAMHLFLKEEELFFMFVLAVARKSLRRCAGTLPA